MGSSPYTSTTFIVWLPMIQSDKCLMVAGTAKYQKFRETAKQYDVMSSSHSISRVTFQNWYGNYGTGGSDLEV